MDADTRSPAEADSVIGLDLGDISDRVAEEIRARLLSPDFDEWAVAAARVSHCARPIALRGWSAAVDKVSGEILSTYRSETAPTGVTYVRCGNRRESACPACSRTYAADTFHLIRSGVVGGKGVPEDVASHPLVFATLTAPSFGAVHSIPSDGGQCRPRSSQPRCRHGHVAHCFQRHDHRDVIVGQAICESCYDYESHIIWQWWAPELWRRLTITLRRSLAHALGVPPGRLGDVAVVQYAKVAEFQLRGAVHFHALIRLDGPKQDGNHGPAPSEISAAVLSDLIEESARSISVVVPPVDENDVRRELRFGRQLDTRIVTATTEVGERLTGAQVAGYLAKYATKSASDSMSEDGNGHVQMLRWTCRDLSHRALRHCAESGRPTENPYALLGKWAHMLGFRGHFSSKSRRYSVTLGQLRRARKRWQDLVAQQGRAVVRLDVRELEDLLLADEVETTLVIGEWRFLGVGWQSDGDIALALAAAQHARERQKAQAAHRRNERTQHGSP